MCCCSFTQYTVNLLCRYVSANDVLSSGNGALMASTCSTLLANGSPIRQHLSSLCSIMKLSIINSQDPRASWSRLSVVSASSHKRSMSVATCILKLDTPGDFTGFPPWTVHASGHTFAKCPDFLQIWSTLHHHPILLGGAWTTNSPHLVLSPPSPHLRPRLHLPRTLSLSTHPSKEG